MYRIDGNVAKYIVDWIKSGRGVAVWGCAELSLGNMKDVLTPARDHEGNPTLKPSWRQHNEPREIFEALNCFEVAIEKEVKRFRVGLKRGRGFSVVVTDGAQRRIDKYLEKYEDSWQVFDYDTQEAVILVPSEVVPLPEYLRRKEEENKK